MVIWLVVILVARSLIDGVYSLPKIRVVATRARIDAVMVLGLVF